MPFTYPSWRLPPLRPPQPIDTVPTGFRDAVQDHARSLGLVSPSWGAVTDAEVVFEYRRMFGDPAQRGQGGTMPSAGPFVGPEKR